MIDDLLEIEIVNRIINDIKSSEKYFNKKFDTYNKYPYDVSKEIILFSFYEALLKYKIIIDDMNLFNDYVSDLDRLFKKIINYYDINDGINKLICKYVANKLFIADLSTPEAREKIIKYLFDKYYVNGYIYHGFSTVYENELKDHGFIPNVYNNRYSKMIEINNIYKKYNDVAFNKDFGNYNVYFTEDFVDACYYSLYSPRYFYRFLLDEHDDDNKHKSCYLENDFDKCYGNVKKSIEKKFDDKDKTIIYSNLKEEWDFLNRVDRRVSIIVVKRSLVEKTNWGLIDSLLNSDENLYDLADRLLNGNNKVIKFSEPLRKDAYKIFSVDYKDKNMFETKDVKLDEIPEKVENNSDVSIVDDVSGSVTVMMLLGSLFVSLGVIVTIIMMLGG